MAKTNTGLVAHAKAQLGLPYIYGTYGKVLTADIVKQKAAQYPTQMYQSRVNYALKNHLGKRSYDCAGLIKSYIFQDTPTSAPRYQKAYDKNVGGLIRACSQTGVMSSIPETDGILVFRKTEHVGVYIGSGYVIEAKGFDCGVVKTKLSEGKWDKWGLLSWITYPVPESAPTVTKEDIYVSEKSFKNTSGRQLNVYADTKLSVKVGSIPAGNSCNCLGIVANRAILRYRLSGTLNTYKVGFTDYVAGLQNE